MAYEQVHFGTHAIRRMFEHNSSEIEVRDVLERGDIIEEHVLDRYATKRIHMAFCERRPIHVVVIDESQIMRTEVVTVYEPDLETWEPGFRRRREP